LGRELRVEKCFLIKVKVEPMFLLRGLAKITQNDIAVHSHYAPIWATLQITLDLEAGRT